MHKFLLFSLTSGVALLVFCFWGLETAAGQAAFPEMAGLLPFYFGGLGACLVILSVVLYLWRRLRTARQLRPSRK